MWEIDRKKCLRCGACVGVCPKLALELKESGINHDEKLCIECGLCKRICPMGAIKVEEGM
ncbi:MAG: 4Fe-4S binding protein [archaeon]|nr:MAG: 4Fe-4S binding protein [archaeon]